MSATLAPHTYLPAARASLTGVAEALRNDDEFALVGPSGRIPLPSEVHDVLVQVVDAMLAGKAVHVTPSDLLLTTQQAADLLGVSRPTVIAIIDRGELAHEKVGTHRRIRMSDLLDYRERRRARQFELLAEMQADLDDDMASGDMERELRAVRAQVAESRKSRRKA